MSASNSEWSFATRFAFRFFFVYLILYSFPQPFDFVEALQKLDEWTLSFWGLLVQPVAEAVFGVAADVLPNGSGDTTFSYVHVFVIAALSLIAAIAWSFLDRNRKNYTRLHEWFRLYVRFVLGFAMLGYGAYKVIKAQFPGPSLDRLLEPVGEMSPMGLLWTFMGASKPYNVFTGF